MFTRYTPPQLPATQAEKVAHPLHRVPPIFLIVFVVAASTTLQRQFKDQDCYFCHNKGHTSKVFRKRAQADRKNSNHTHQVVTDDEVPSAGEEISDDEYTTLQSGSGSIRS